MPRSVSWLKTIVLTSSEISAVGMPRMAILGIPTEEVTVDFNQLVFKMLTLRGIYGREMYETWYKMSVMLQSGLDIRPVITHRFPYGEFLRGFEVMATGNSGRVVLDWEAS